MTTLCRLVAGALALAGCHCAHAFTLLNFRSLQDIQNGQFHFWQPDTAGEQTLTLSYAIDANFLASSSTVDKAAARAAATRALQTWVDAFQGAATHTIAPWPAVPNQGVSPPAAWEGPFLDDWFADQNLPTERQQYPGSLPGWGANFDIFSRPTGFTLDSGVLHFEMGPGNLGFTVINRTGNALLSVDIYLNEDFIWTDDGSAGFDIETVILHELGHGFGLDHPQEAQQYGGVNLDPDSFLPGAPWSPADVMHPDYTGIKRALTADEAGGLRFLYGVVSPIVGDLNSDTHVNASDLSLLLGAWGTNNPLADLNADGTVDAFDLAILFGAWT